MKIITAAIAASAFFIPASAQASIIFNLNGTYANGGTLTGTFSTNDARTVLESLALTSTAFGTNIFNNLAGATLSSLPNNLQLDLSSPFREVKIVFSPSLSASGATIGAGSYEAQGTLRNSTTLSGSVTAVAAVPEPATWAMLLVGFGAVGFGLRRQKAEVRVRFAA